MTTTASAQFWDRAIITFPGQGSQAVGMGKSLYDASAEARNVFDAFNQRVAPAAHPETGAPCSLLGVMFEGPESLLQQTRFTQPAIAAVSAALTVVLKSRMPGWQPLATAGHSLGEYPALFAAGVISLEELVALVCRRGELMQEAPEGGMVAVIGMAVEKTRELVAQLQQDLSTQHGRDVVLVLANENTDQQQVLAMEKALVSPVADAFKAAGAKRALPLPVGGAFHSPLMAPPAELFQQTLSQVTYQPPQCSVLPNVTAQPTTDATQLMSLSAQQMTHSVRWNDTMAALLAMNPTAILEVGPGAVLTGMIKRHPALNADACQVMAVGDLDTLNTLATPALQGV